MGTEGQESAAGKHIDYRVEGRLPQGRVKVPEVGA
jgi:hypothetical protein